VKVFPRFQELLALYEQIEAAWARHHEQGKLLVSLWVRYLSPSRFYISLHRPSKSDARYEYPVFKFHQLNSKKGSPRGKYAAAILSRYKAARRGQARWWRDHKSLIEPFNRWMKTLQKERRMLRKLRRRLDRLVEHARRSLIVLFPASHNAALFIERELQVVKNKAAAPLLAAMPPVFPQELRP
jgi:hypothetical protein